MEIRTYQITCYVCPRCDSRGVFDMQTGQVVRHDCGWGGMVTAVLGVHGFCVDERGVEKLGPIAASLHAELSQGSCEALDISTLRSTVELLADRNVQEIKDAGGWLPTVYLSNIQVSTGGEELRPISSLVEARTASHEELTAWRLAELRAKGERAEPLILFTDRGGIAMFVKRADGSIEDVSSEMRKRRK